MSKPKVNEDPKDALLKQYEEEIKNLKDMLDRMNSGKGLG
jgi:kinesin family protein 3/17